LASLAWSLSTKNKFFSVSLAQVKFRHTKKFWARSNATSVPSLLRFDCVGEPALNQPVLGQSHPKSIRDSRGLPSIGSLVAHSIGNFVLSIGKSFLSLADKVIGAL
jgi:hypothetical protein